MVWNCQKSIRRVHFSTVRNAISNRALVIHIRLHLDQSSHTGRINWRNWSNCVTVCILAQQLGRLPWQIVYVSKNSVEKHIPGIRLLSVELLWSATLLIAKNPNYVPSPSKSGTLPAQEILLGICWHRLFFRLWFHLRYLPPRKQKSPRCLSNVECATTWHVQHF